MQATTQKFAPMHIHRAYKPALNLGRGASTEKIQNQNFAKFFKTKNSINQIRVIFPFDYVYTRKHCLEVSQNIIIHKLTESKILILRKYGLQKKIYI